MAFPAPRSTGSREVRQGQHLLYIVSGDTRRSVISYNPRTMRTANAQTKPFQLLFENARATQPTIFTKTGGCGLYQSHTHHCYIVYASKKKRFHNAQARASCFRVDDDADVFYPLALQKYEFYMNLKEDAPSTGETRRRTVPLYAIYAVEATVCRTGLSDIRFRIEATLVLSDIFLSCRI